MSNTSTKRMRMIADGLAEEGNYTRGASVYACAGERDALWRLMGNIRFIAECTKAPDAIKSILAQIEEHTEKEQEG